MGALTLRSPVALCGVLAMLGLLGAAFSSDNALLWIATAGTIFLCGALLQREGAIVPTLLTTAVIYWVGVVADLMYADRLDVSVELLGGGAYRSEAIVISCLALVVIIVGVKLGFRCNTLTRQASAAPAGRERISTRGAVAVYLAALVLSSILGTAAYIAPGLTQPLLALGSVHLVALFILIRALLRQPNSLALLTLVLAFETAAGLIGSLSSYQAPYVIIFAAALSSRDARRFGFREVAALTIGFVLLVYISLVWTAIKPEYRVLLSVADLSATQKLRWILSKVTNGNIDYDRAYTDLLARLGYTKFYALSLGRYDLGALPTTHFWWSAIQNVLMPRALFPDKAALNDTAVTTLMTGVQFAEGTSVSVGYVAQAHVDFGFPLMLMPLLALGAALGLATRYFMASDGPEFLKSGFAASVATTSFQFAENIEKLIGAFSLTVLALVVLFRWRAVIERRVSQSSRMAANRNGRRLGFGSS